MTAQSAEPQQLDLPEPESALGLRIFFLGALLQLQLL